MATIDFAKKSGSYGYPKITVKSEPCEHDEKFKLYRHYLNSYSQQSFFCFKFKCIVKILFTYEEFRTDKVTFIEAYFRNDGLDELIIFGFVTTKNVKKYFRFDDLVNDKITDISKNYISEGQLIKELERVVPNSPPESTLAELDALDICYRIGRHSYQYKGTTIHSTHNNFDKKYEFVHYKYSSFAKIIEGKFTIKYMELRVNFIGDVVGDYCNQVLFYVSRSEPNTPIMIAFGISGKELRYILFSEFVKNNELTIRLSTLSKIRVGVDSKQSNYLMEGELLNLLYRFNPQITNLAIIDTKQLTTYYNVQVSENAGIGDFQSFTHKPVGNFQHTLIECAYLSFTIKDYNPSDYGFDNLQHVVLYYSIQTNDSIPLMIEIVTNRSKLHNSGGGVANQSEFFVLRQIFEVSQYYERATLLDEWNVTYEITDLKAQNVECKLKELLKLYRTPMELMPDPKHKLRMFAVLVCIFGSVTLVAALVVIMPRYSRMVAKMIRKLYHIH